MEVQLSSKLYAAYNELKETAILQLADADVLGINAAVLANKLLQVASGSVYAEGDARLIDTGRYELVLELVEEVDQSIVFFQWHHQREALEVEAKKRGVNYEIIDRTVPERRRAEIVAAYQEGVFQTLFLHPKSAAHGLTLTRGTRTIWASPTYEPDIFKQGNHRLYRVGQKQKTEVIMIAAEGTIEPQVYAKMREKNTRMVNLLEILQS
jgi:SNF2 family DNA or RNA helicase